MGTVFSGKRGIYKFNEFTLFTNITIVSGFDNSSIEEITFPPSIKTGGGSAFYNSELKAIHINEGCEVILDRCLYGTKIQEDLVLPSTLLSFEGVGIYSGNTTYKYNMIVLAQIPPQAGTTAGWVWRNTLINVYVPDESLSAYINANGWSDMASIILPISSLPRD